MKTGVDLTVRITAIHGPVYEWLQVGQCSAFVLQSEIGDLVEISGLVSDKPLIATLDAMLADSGAYQSCHAHHGPPPT